MARDGKVPAARAREAFVSGANCAEALWQAFNDGLEQDEQDLGNCLAGGFGGGAQVGDLCGAITGGILVLGLNYGRTPGQPRNPKLKELCKAFYQRAQAEMESVYCRDLRDPEDKDYRDKCVVLVERMAAIIAELLVEEHPCCCQNEGASEG